MLPDIYACSPGPYLPTRCAYLCIVTCHGNHVCWSHPVLYYSFCAWLGMCAKLDRFTINSDTAQPIDCLMHRIAGQPTLNLLTARTSAVLHSTQHVVLLCAGADGGGCGARPWMLSGSTLWRQRLPSLPSLLASCCYLAEDDELHRLLQHDRSSCNKTSMSLSRASSDTHMHCESAYFLRIKASL